MTYVSDSSASVVGSSTSSTSTEHKATSAPHDLALPSTCGYRKKEESSYSIQATLLFIDSPTAVYPGTLFPRIFLRTTKHFHE